MNTERICPGCMHDNGGEKICPVCGYNSVTENNGEDALKIKSVLKQQYFVGKKLSVNSEGITYLGFDAAQGAVVEIKEYFPAGISLRKTDGSVAVKKGNPKFVKAINSALEDMKKDGTYKKIFVKWFGEEPPAE